MLKAEYRGHTSCLQRDCVERKGYAGAQNAGDRRDDRRTGAPWPKEHKGRIAEKHPGGQIQSISGAAQGIPETRWRRVKAGYSYGSRASGTAGDPTDKEI